MRIAAQYDIKPHEFWEMTHIELMTWIEGKKELIEYENKKEMQNIIAQAWYNTYYSKCFKKLPKLSNELERILNTKDPEEKLLENIIKYNQALRGDR